MKHIFTDWQGTRGRKNIMTHLRTLYPDKKIRYPLWVQNPMKYKNTPCGEGHSVIRVNT